MKTIFNNTTLQLLSLVCIISFIFGCSKNESDEHKPMRILSLSTAATDILIKLEQPPIAIDEYGTIAIKNNSNIQVIGKGSSVSLEKVIELEITHAILWYYQIEVENLLNKNGIHTSLVYPSRLDSYSEFIQKIGQIINQETKAQQLVEAFNQEIDSINLPQGKTPIKVYFELYSPLNSLGDQTYIGDLVRKAGGQCITHKTGLINSEIIIEQAPDVIFYVEGFTEKDKISSHPVFSYTPAVKNQKIYAIKRELIVEGLAPIDAINFLKQKMEQ